MNDKELIVLADAKRDELQENLDKLGDNIFIEYLNFMDYPYLKYKMMIGERLYDNSFSDVELLKIFADDDVDIMAVIAQRMKKRNKFMKIIDNLFDSVK